LRDGLNLSVRPDGEMAHEVLSYGRGLTNEGDAWLAPSIELGSHERTDRRS